MNHMSVVISLVLLCVFVDSSYWDDIHEYHEADYTDFNEQLSTTPETTTPEDDVLFFDIFRPDSTTSENTYEDHTINFENDYTTPTSDENVDTFKHEVNTVSPEVKLMFQNLTQTIANLTSEVKRQQGQLAELVNNNSRLQEKVEFMEQQTKTNSLIFFNVPGKDHETYKTTLNKVVYVLNKLLKLNIQAAEIAVALRSDRGEAATYRPIVVRFTNFATKMKVLAARSRLQNSQVVIEAAYSEGVARTRTQLVPYLTAAKAKGLQAFILYNQLVVNGRKWTLQELIDESQKDSSSLFGSGSSIRISTKDIY